MTGAIWRPIPVMTREGTLGRIDIIIPCYNHGHFLYQCVDSVLGQVGVEVRVLVIDDASPDKHGGSCSGSSTGKPEGNCYINILPGCAYD
jgi:cellulose synthase/poly-beta-1,6-N-acetylglucosamine synthase-like glycosyltransferase